MRYTLLISDILVINVKWYMMKSNRLAKSSTTYQGNSISRSRPLDCGSYLCHQVSSDKASKASYGLMYRVLIFCISLQNCTQRLYQPVESFPRLLIQSKFFAEFLFYCPTFLQIVITILSQA